MQLVNALQDTSKVVTDKNGRIGIQSASGRYDTYGNTVNDLAALNWSSGKPTVELFSVMPKGDGFKDSARYVENHPAAQMERAATLPRNTALMGGGVTPQEFRRINVQPIDSLSTEMDVRNEIARINAAKMLGLPENNTALDRAKAMGFDTEAFHGTNSDIASFSRIDGGNMWGKAHYLTDSAEDGSKYATGWHNRITPAGDAGPNVMPLMTRGRFFDMDANVSKREINALSKVADLSLDDYLFDTRARNVYQALRMTIPLTAPGPCGAGAGREKFLQRPSRFCV